MCLIAFALPVPARDEDLQTSNSTDLSRALELVPSPLISMRRSSVAQGSLASQSRHVHRFHWVVPLVYRQCSAQQQSFLDNMRV